MNQRVDEIKKFLSETEVTRTKGIPVARDRSDNALE